VLGWCRRSAVVFKAVATAQVAIEKRVKRQVVQLVVGELFRHLDTPKTTG
jgi:hypothetical protein